MSVRLILIATISIYGISCKRDKPSSTSSISESSEQPQQEENAQDSSVDENQNNLANRPHETTIWRWDGFQSVNDSQMESIGAFEGGTCSDALMACVKYFASAKIFGMCTYQNDVAVIPVTEGFVKLSDMQFAQQVCMLQTKPSTDQ